MCAMSALIGAELPVTRPLDFKHSRNIPCVPHMAPPGYGLRSYSEGLLAWR